MVNPRGKLAYHIELVMLLSKVVTGTDNGQVTIDTCMYIYIYREREKRERDVYIYVYICIYMFVCV